MVTSRSASKPGCCTHTDASPRSSTSQIVWRSGRGVVELDDDPAGGQPLGVDPPVHPPRQRDRVDLVRVELVEQPLRPPTARAPSTHRLEVLAGRGEVVLVAPPGRRRPGLDDALALEVPQPLHQQRARDAGQAAGDVVEPGVAEHQLADDQRRPAVGEHLAGQGDRAEVCRSRARAHRRTPRPPGSPESVLARSRSWTRCASRDRSYVPSMTTTMERTDRPASWSQRAAARRRRARRARRPPRRRRHVRRGGASSTSATPACSPSPCPSELGGGGATIREVAMVQRELAHHCGSTALATLDAPARHRLHGVALPPRPARRRGHPAARRRRGHRARLHRRRRLHPPARRGHQGRRRLPRVSGRKSFASQSPVGTVMSTMFALRRSRAGPAGAQHGRADRRRGRDRRSTTGTRSACGAPAATTSCIDDVFVPDERVLANRPYGVVDPPLQVIVSIAMPIISAVYLGVAEARVRGTPSRPRPARPTTRSCSARSA